jgi:hypothetical protein
MPGGANPPRGGVIFSGVLLAIGFGSYFGLGDHTNIRNVDFVSIFVLGTIAGVFLTRLQQVFSAKD